MVCAVQRKSFSNEGTPAIDGIKIEIDPDRWVMKFLGQLDGK
jgi:hypothetical protein